MGILIRYRIAMFYKLNGIIDYCYDRDRNATSACNLSPRASYVRVHSRYVKLTREACQSYTGCMRGLSRLLLE